MLYTAPDPQSEIGERLHDTVQIWITLLFCSGTTPAVTWWCTDHALARQLVAVHEDGRRVPA